MFYNTGNLVSGSSIERYNYCHDGVHVAYDDPHHYFIYKKYLFFVDIVYDYDNN